MNFVKSSKYYRVLCKETFEEQVFNTLYQCKQFIKSGRKLMPDESLSFTVTKVTEESCEM